MRNAGEIFPRSHPRVDQSTVLYSLFFVLFFGGARGE